MKLLIIMPLYNQEKFVRDAIESVIQQTHKNWELVIIDDRSTDNSVKIVEKYTYIPNITLLKNKENRGCYYSRNRGLEYFKDIEWDVFTIHDPDDISDITRFEKILDEMGSNILGVRPLYVETDENLNILYENNSPKTFNGEGQAFYRRIVFDKILGYYDNIRFSGDTDYWWRLEAYCNLNPQYKNILSHLPLYLRRNHQNNLTKKYSWETDRRNYFIKSKNDIHTMFKTGNFYREKFD